MDRNFVLSFKWKKKPKPSHNFPQVIEQSCIFLFLCYLCQQRDCLVCMLSSTKICFLTLSVKKLFYTCVFMRNSVWMTHQGSIWKIPINKCYGDLIYFLNPSSNSLPLPWFLWLRHRCSSSIIGRCMLESKIENSSKNSSYLNGLLVSSGWENRWKFGKWHIYAPILQLWPI